jgi:PAS domain S-box-containing protein
MTNELPQSTEQSLLQFLYVCPIGLVEFDDLGLIVRINPQAVNVLSSLVGPMLSDNIFEVLGPAWPELAKVVANGPKTDGLAASDYRVRSAVPRPTVLSINVVRVGPNQNMLTLSDVSESDRAEAFAEQQQTILETLIMTAPVGIALYDSEFRCLQINDVLAQDNGVSIEHSIGRSPAEYLPLLWPQLEPLFHRALTEPIQDVEVSGFTPSEPLAQRWWLTSFNPIVLPDQQSGFVVVVVDITGRKRAELALIEQQNQLWSVFSSIDEGFSLCEVIFDDSGKAVDWRYLALNPQFEEMSGIANALGKTILELIPDFEYDWIERFANLAVNGGVLRFEQESKALGRWFDVFATSVGVTGRFAVVFKDQTEKRKADEAILRQASFDAYRAQFAESLRDVKQRDRLGLHASESLGSFLGADRVYFLQLDDELDRGMARNEYWKDDEIRNAIDQPRLSNFDAIMTDQIRAGQLVHVNDMQTDDRFSEAQREDFEHVGVRSVLVAPVAKLGQPVGAIVVQFCESHAWSEHERALIDEVAHRALVALDQLLAAERTLRRQVLSDAVAEVLADLELLSSVEEQAQRIVEMLIVDFADYATFETPGAPDSIVALAHSDPDMLPTLRTLREMRTVEPSAPLSIFRAADGDAQLLSKITETVVDEYVKDDETKALLAHLGPRSHLAVPIEIGGSERAALMVGRTSPDRDRYDANDLEFLRTAALRFGVVIAATRWRRAEHTISERLQKALLPDRVVWHADVDAAARYHAASAFMQVGGDWYDSFTWPTGEIGLMVGDVVGHNLESAAAMGRLRAGLAAVAPKLAASPASLLDALHRCAQGPEGTPFVTATCVVIDPSTGMMKYSSAGHPPTLVLSPNGNVSRLGDAQGPPLTPMQTYEWSERAVQLEPGSLVFMYSDGLVERRGERIDQGIDRLEKAVRSAYGQRSSEVADCVLTEMGDQTVTEDDVVIVCVRYTPAIAHFDSTVEAKPSELAGLRANARAWLNEQQLSTSVINDVLLAVGEACSNSVEHAYQSEPNPTVSMQMHIHDQYLVAVVTDHGTWGVSSRPRGQGGRGTRVMSALSVHYDRTTTPNGTVVTLSIPTVDDTKAFLP